MFNINMRERTAARVLQIWELQTAQQLRQVRVVGITCRDRAVVVPACEDPGHGRQTQVSLTRHRELDRYKLIGDVGFPIPCLGDEAAREYARFLRVAGLEKVFADGSRVLVNINQHIDPGLIDEAHDEGWIRPIDRSRLLAELA